MRRVVFTQRARQQAAEAAEWWRKHREKAPEAFEADVVAGTARIAMNPNIGRPSHRVGIRKLFLARIRYYLYYRVASEDLVEVIAVWHASRHPPRL
jgi:plasmid stabilization system protein ParE